MSKPIQPPEPSQPRGGSWLAVLFSLVALVLAGTLLAVLPIGLLGVAFVLGGGLFLIVIAFHYFTWGIWMTRALRKEQEDDEDR